MSKPGFATIFTIPTGVINHLGNETRADQTVQMYRLSSPLVVRIWHKLVFVCGTVSSMLSGLKTRSLGLNTFSTT